MKKIKIILLIVFNLLTLNACKNDEPSLETFSIENLTIPYEQNIFSLKESEYYILFYSPKCKACLDTLKFVEYLYNEHNFDIYLINILENKIAINKLNGTNLYCSSINDFYLFKTPYLVNILEGSIVNEETGFNNIRNYLNEQIKITPI